MEYSHASFTHFKHFCFSFDRNRIGSDRRLTGPDWHLQSDRSGARGLFVVGALLLFGYGFSLNFAPVEFRQVVGLYIATLFIMWQTINFLIFRTTPNAPILMGGALIVAGGLIVTFWKSAPTV